MSVTARNNRVTAMMDEFFEDAELGVYTQLDAATTRSIERAFSTPFWGFREILLVIVLARLLDRTYKASVGFYACKPRALYEGPIRAVLLARGIPHKKSGPLNVAKATVGINAAWATQRKPADVAQEVVSLVQKIEAYTPTELENFATALHGRFLQEAVRVAHLTVEAQPEADPTQLYNLCQRLINEAPDAGNTPQRIVGYLLDTYHQELQTGVRVVGHEDAASTTSTTSKKPGDITEEQADGTIMQVYEVTVKPFGADRVRESYETVRDYDEGAGTSTSEVLVLCRRQDSHTGATKGTDAALNLGTLEHEDLTYRFLNIYEWIAGQLLRMTPDARLAFHEKMQAYIALPNTSESVKLLWARLHAS